MDDWKTWFDQKLNNLPDDNQWHEVTDKYPTQSDYKYFEKRQGSRIRCFAQRVKTNRA